MIGPLLLRGLLAGLTAGLLAATFAFFVGEPAVERAIALEEAAHHHAAAGEAGAASEGEPGHSHAVEAPLVSRGGQRFGLFVSGALAGLAVGGLFALVFAFARGRLRRSDDWSTAIWLAGVLFVAVSLVPALKYPATPPGVGDPATIDERTWLYVTAIAISLLALLAAWRVSRQLPGGQIARQIAGVATFAAIVAVAFLALPTFREVPPNYPSDLLWEFRLASLGTQLILWAALGTLLGASGLLRAGRARRESPAT